MEPLKKIYPSAVTQDGSLPYDAMATQLIEWRMMLAYMRGKIERGEEVDCEQYIELMAAIDKAIDSIETRLVCSLSIKSIIAN